MIINPWTYYIVNDKMPEFPSDPDGDKNGIKGIIVWLVLSLVFIAAMIYIPFNVKYYTESWIWFVISVIIIVTSYICLLIYFLKKILK